MSYQACIFDLDGTLCDSVESIAWSGNQMLRDLGLRQASLEDYKIFVGDGVDVADAPAAAFLEEMRRASVLMRRSAVIWNISRKAAFTM